jgi:hypothetical protein
MKKDIIPTGKAPKKYCFIHGILHRSGTNYLYRLVREHPEIAGSGPVWEDFFLHYSHLQRAYIDAVKSQWDPKWEIEKKIGSLERLERFFGDGIKKFLDYQLDFFDERIDPKVVLTKTPSVHNIEYFFDYFPNDYLILIVRDGRSLVESGVRSFGWSYERGMQKWAAAAQSILDLQNKGLGNEKRLLIVRYEDLYRDESHELTRIFNFLNVDADKYPFDKAKNLGITGSSELKRKEGKVHWKITKKDKTFNPLSRSDNWSLRRHKRFNWLAGKQMKSLGYEVKDVKTSPISHFQNKIKNFIWQISEFAAQSKYIEIMARKIKKLIKW